MIRGAIILVLLAGAGLIVWLLFPCQLPSFVLAVVLLAACAVLLTGRPLRLHGAVKVALVVGIILGVAATYVALFAPLPVSPTTRFYLWASAPGAALLYVIQGGGPIYFPGIPILTANVVMYSFAALVVAGFVTVVGRLVTAARKRKPGPGYCPTCGYNLTGNVSGVCPECGTEVKQP
jgi:hypothetical protein